MFKRLGILAILVVMALMVSVPAVAAQVDLTRDQGQSPPSLSHRGQALITGSFWIEFNNRVIHINLNARAVEDWGGGFYGPAGHIHWREVGGQSFRMSPTIMIFDTPFPPDYETWWPSDCAFVRGWFGPTPDDYMCLQICGDRVHNLWWKGEQLIANDYPETKPEYNFTRGNVIIKPPPRVHGMVSGDVIVQNTGVYYGPELIFPPPYDDVEDGEISRFVFNAIRGSERVDNPIGMEVWEATGYLFWLEGDEVYMVDIQYMLQDGEGWWPHFPPQPRCNYISGYVVSEHDPPFGGMCFVVCDLPEPFVYVAALDMFPMYRFDVLQGSVYIIE